MGYQIEAYLDNGKPTLKIYDIKRQALCLSWTYAKSLDATASECEVHRLFRELLLLTCKQDMHNIRVFNLSPPQRDNQTSQTVFLS